MTWRWRGEAAAKTSYSLAFLNFGQAVLITVGLVVVMLLAAGRSGRRSDSWRFRPRQRHMIQITMPLNFLTVYREIRQALVDMRQMFDLLDEPPEVSDRPHAPALGITNGHVSLERVSFSYDQSDRFTASVSTSRPVRRRDRRAVGIRKIDNRSSAVPFLRRHRRCGSHDGQDVRCHPSAFIRPLRRSSGYRAFQ